MKKIFITTAIIATLATTSITAFAAVTPSGSNVCTSTALAKVQANDTAVAKGTVQGNIEYAKKTLFNPDGSIAAIDESWANPSTHDQREDYSEPVTGKGDIVRVQSCYLLDNETKYVKAGRDENGSFSGIVFSGDNLGNALKAEKQDYINEYKDGTRSAGWKDKGIAKTEDGKNLIELSRMDTSLIPGDEGKTFIENIYLDKDSRLPVKGDISVEKDGKTSLLYTYTYEFKNVVDEGGLFDTKEIKLQEKK